MEMVQFSDLVFGKLLGEGSGEPGEVGGHSSARTASPVCAVRTALLLAPRSVLLAACMVPGSTCGC